MCHFAIWFSGKGGIHSKVDLKTSEIFSNVTDSMILYETEGTSYVSVKEEGGL